MLGVSAEIGMTGPVSSLRSGASVPGAADANPPPLSDFLFFFSGGASGAAGSPSDALSPGKLPVEALTSELLSSVSGCAQAERTISSATSATAARAGCERTRASGPTALSCLLYTSDAADDLLCVDLGGRRIIKKKKKKNNN